MMKIEEKVSECYLEKFDKKFPVLPTLKGKQLEDFKNFLNTCKQIFGLINRPKQAELFDKLALLWAVWGVEHLQGLNEDEQDDTAD